MKNKIFAALFGIFATIAFVACSSDDDGGSSSIPSPIITDENGEAYQVASAGGIKFTYDENGKLTSFTDNDGYHEIDKNSFKFEYEDMMLSVTLNSNGTMSKAQTSRNEKAPDGSYAKANVTISFQYNSERQLTGASYSQNIDIYYKEDNDRETLTASGTLKNTWSNGILTKSVQEDKYTETENDEKYTCHSIATYTYEYGEQENKLKQFPYFMADGSARIFDISLDAFCIVGLYGVGPKYFPTGYTVTERNEYDDNGYKYTDNNDNTYSLSFILNGNGTINTEKRGSYESLTYIYNNVSRAAALEQVESILPSLKDQMQKMLTRRHKK